MVLVSIQQHQTDKLPRWIINQKAIILNGVFKIAHSKWEEINVSKREEMTYIIYNIINKLTHLFYLWPHVVYIIWPDLIDYLD